METLNLLQALFDVSLGLGLIWLAWRALACEDLFRAIVLFVSFGLLMALVWVRLGAIDVALAEAAIGAGLTGALLMAALARLNTQQLTADDADQAATLREKFSALTWLSRLAVLMVAGGTAYTIMLLPPDAPGLGAEVTAQLSASGVSNPVTAVLLNFRGYDTLLEIIVLLAALLAVWSLRGAAASPELMASPVLDTLTRILVPILILVSAYLLWIGAHAPGGAFQAGSVLGAAGVLILLAGWRLHVYLPGLPFRLVLVAGPLVFLIVAIITLLLEHSLLQFPQQHAGALILLLETCATLSIGATLAALFLGGSAWNIKPHKDQRDNASHQPKGNLRG